MGINTVAMYAKGGTGEREHWGAVQVSRRERDLGGEGGRILETFLKRIIKVSD